LGIGIGVGVDVEVGVFSLVGDGVLGMDDGIALELQAVSRNKTVNVSFFLK
jgi:hypothetical protein